MIYKAIGEIVAYALRKELIEEEDRVWAINRLMKLLSLDDYHEAAIEENRSLEDILGDILSYAIDKGVIEDSQTRRDLFDTEIMGVLTPKPSCVRRSFMEKYQESPEKATNWYYALSQNTDYIRSYRIKKDVKWVTSTVYGDLDITINLSKPEKDPRDIAAAGKAAASDYPKCQLCPENEGYAGRMNHPARANHRIIPIQIDGKDWFFQYSPYVYYNEHCIALSGEHVPMKIDRSSFRKLLDFVKIFPHYFVGSNADLPIVGGSILSHDHFQGGRYTFAMEKAPIEIPLSFPGFEDVEAGIVRWPMSVIRIKSRDDGRLVELADKILATWRGYTDEEAMIYAETDGEKHSTITPIARMREGKYELDLVLRNNLCTAEHPMGLYHPHSELHHIKKENIGLIEVMGLAVLPARLKTELAELENALIEGRDISADEVLAKHEHWAKKMKERYNFTEENAGDILREEVGQIFAKVLEHAGVYKCTDEGRAAFLKFTNSIM